METEIGAEYYVLTADSDSLSCTVLLSLGLRLLSAELAFNHAYKSAR